MYKIWFNQADNPYELRELVRMFLPPGAYEILDNDPWEYNFLTTPGDLLVRVPDKISEKNEGKRYLYDELSRCTGKKPEWGILTGVRPVKLTGELLHREGSEAAVFRLLTEDYRLHKEKAELLLDTWKTQQEILFDSNDKALGIYVGIPFCPTRCVYCSFPSYQVAEEQMQQYLLALKQEIEYTAKVINERGAYAESLYIGGGTPTTLNETALQSLLSTIRENFDLKRVCEYTVEAGRPDTITEEKLSLIRENGADRISINPQTMKAETLRKIGREHSPEQILEAYKMARKYAFSSINMDLIAGLPDENPEDFKRSLELVLSLAPENITVHTLALKRASKLKAEEDDYNYRQGQTVGNMLQIGASLLKEAGYRPYYLYRQKQMTGNFENVGYSLPGKESLYNTRIMEENQSIIALGAGGISKILNPKENKLERIANVSNYEIYIEKIEEMIERKRKGIFL
ncbi:MAG: coproporphyrinogen dehydrogenase HemZ [Eubacteriales bacterium]|nr:coproporphyrinogen dehydrogenase HemZ [Eubacteriales bacterium]MDD3349488.1 coproporphyrinogen dehydrogenase HemZ [Eubacteriales bacterium]